MILHVSKTSDSVKKAAETKIKNAFKKVIPQLYEDDEVLFLITKQANSIDNLELNLFFL